jgi:hypothetical protein
MYNQLNKIFLITYVNFGYRSLQMAESLNEFKKFSDFLEEIEESAIYSKHMLLVLKKLRKVYNLDESDININTIKIGYYHFTAIESILKIIDTNDLKRVEEVIKLFEEYKNLFNYEKLIQINNPPDTDRDKISLIFQIHNKVYNISHHLKYFTPKKYTSNMKDLISKIESTLGKEDSTLLDPLLDLSRHYLRGKNLTNFIKHSTKYQQVSDRVYFLDDLAYTNCLLQFYAQMVQFVDKDNTEAIWRGLNIINDQYSKIFATKDQEYKSGNFKNVVHFADLFYSFGVVVLINDKRLTAAKYFNLAYFVYNSQAGEQGAKTKKVYKIADMLRNEDDLFDKE